MPENFYDLPFIYVSDGDDFTDGNNYDNIAVDLVNNSDFLLRRICGVNNVAAKFRFRDANSSDRIQRPISMPNDYPVVPELIYPAGSRISYDLQTVARANNAYATQGSIPNYYSQIAFQGVRRFYNTPTPDSPYRYYERPYTIRMDFNVDWTGRMAPSYTVKASTNKFSVLVDNWDFEMQSICVLIKTASQTTYSVSQNKLKLAIYTHQEQALMSAPVLDSYLTTGGLQYNSWFPVPTILYPSNSVIRVEVESLLVEAEVPASVTILFNGLWRFPC
jgi:hypothetical protein